jgi:cell pole-organizing protein PopZ
MEDIMTDIRRAVTDEEAGEMAPRTAETRQATGGNPEAGLLSREATAAVGSAFSTLTETVKKHEPTLEDVVRETLRPMLKSWLDENLPRLVEQMVQAEIERVARGR